MHTPIKIIVAASLLLLSGNAAAIMISNQLYGSSGYSLNDIDVAILAFQDNISGRKAFQENISVRKDKRRLKKTIRKDNRRLKKAIRLDRKIKQLAGKIDRAMLSDKIRKAQRKNKRLGRKEAKMLAILADYLPELDKFMQNGNMPEAGDIAPPEPDVLLPLLEIELTAEPSNHDGNTPPGATTTYEDSSGQTETAAIPEPSMLALLGLGFAGLMFAGRKRIKGN